MGPVPPPAATDLTDAELEALLDAPESAEERAALDALPSDPDEVLRRARKQAQPDEPPKL